MLRRPVETAADSSYTRLRNLCLTNNRFVGTSGPVHHSITYSWSRPIAALLFGNLPFSITFYHSRRVEKRCGIWFRIDWDDFFRETLAVSRISGNESYSGGWLFNTRGVHEKGPLFYTPANRIISGEVLKYLNGFFIGERYETN